MTISSDSSFRGQTRPLKILFYIDSGAMVAHCVTAAELIRNQLEVEIIVMMVDAKKYLDETVKNYQVYDYGSLFRAGRKFSKVWPLKKSEEKFRKPFAQFAEKPIRGFGDEENRDSIKNCSSHSITVAVHVDGGFSSRKVDPAICCKNPAPATKALAGSIAGSGK